MAGIKMIRNIDRTGRIIVPKDIRKMLNIKFDDNLEFTVSGDFIILKKCMKVRKIKWE